LIIYQVLPNNWSILLLRQSKNGSLPLLTLFNQSNHFRVVLIGLGGTLKEERKDYFEPQKLFSIIDRMPMIKAGLRRKK
jgi:hypothetical protein|tara:strand:+ start:1698 stop:1934 length:237 start_codon:yes stop_codon:yes gene_type:complete